MDSWRLSIVVAMRPGLEVGIMRVLLGTIAWLFVPFLAALAGAQISASDDYVQLVQPSWAPPGWLFGPVWTCLYLLMGISAAMLWRRVGFKGAGFALGLFLVQLILNALWSWIFFGLQQRGWAFIEILVLWAFILATIIAFWKRHRVAGALLMPYLAWVTFALVLNFAIWRMNA